MGYPNGVCDMSHNNRHNSPDNDETGEVISWVIVFIMMIAFWPVGLLLLFKKLRANSMPSANESRRSGWQTADHRHHSSWESGPPPWEVAGDAARNAASQAANAVRNTGDAARYAASQAANAARNTGDAARYAASQAANSARSAGDAARNAASQYANAARNAGEAARNAASQAISAALGTGGTGGTGDTAPNAAPQYSAPQYADASKQAAPEFKQGVAYDFSTPNKKKKSSKKGRPGRLERKSGKFVATILLLTSIVLFIIGATRIASAAQSFFGDGLNDWFDLSMGLFFLTGALISFFSRNIGVRRFARYKNYYAFAAGRDIVSIPDLALAAGLSVKAVTRDILAMINDGYFAPGAYYDSELNSLVLSPEAAKEARQAARSAGAVRQEPPRSTEIPPNPYMAIIIELRELNDTIADIPISDKIDRIEETTAKIFRIVEENPDKQPQIRRFMNYYLPTTLKLLRSYATLEKQGIKGENITSAKENIGRILDTLAKGFEQQLDQLFKSDAIDIAADITVLENLMQQDGLTNDKPELRVMEGRM